MGVLRYILGGNSTFERSIPPLCLPNFIMYAGPLSQTDCNPDRHPPLTATYQHRKGDRGFFASIPRTSTQSKVRLPPPTTRHGMVLIFFSRSNDERPTVEASAARKRLVEAFAHYDAAAKRIQGLPCTRGGSQDRVQTAILTRANLFLQKNMFPLQVRIPSLIHRTN